MFKLFVLLTVLSVGYTAVYRELQKIQPGEPYVCKDSDGTTHEPGSKWYPKGECVRKECFGVSDDQVEIVGASCGAVGGPKHCLVSDLTKSYPDCCPKPKQNCQ